LRAVQSATPGLPGAELLQFTGRNSPHSPGLWEVGSPHILKMGLQQTD
jgi:hypothetical protein